MTSVGRSVEMRKLLYWTDLPMRRVGAGMLRFNPNSGHYRVGASCRVPVRRVELVDDEEGAVQLQRLTRR